MNSFTPNRPRANMPCCGMPMMGHGPRLNGKNPHAVALGKMSSPEKAAAAQANGEKGGRPKGS